MTDFGPVIAGCMKWGEWGARFDTEGYLRMIGECLDAEVLTFDHADIYGGYTTEAEFGAALARSPGLRQRMRLISKCGIRMVSHNRPDHQVKHYDTSEAHIVASVERSLANLRTDRLDLLLIHRPDPIMDASAVAGAFEKLRREGKVLHFGVSNFNVSQMELLHRHFPIEVNQTEVSAVHTDSLFDGVLDYCQREGLRPQAWSPLGGEKLFSRTSREEERNRRILAVADILAETHSASPDRILLAWLMRHPAGIVPVVGTSRADRIRSAMDATRIQLSAQEWFMVLRASTGREVP